MISFGVGKGRKRVLLIAPSILAARKLTQYDGGKRVPATVAAISDAIRWAEEDHERAGHSSNLYIERGFRVVRFELVPRPQ